VASSCGGGGTVEVEAPLGSGGGGGHTLDLVMGDPNVGDEPSAQHEGYLQRAGLSIHDTFVHPKEVFVDFCRKPQVLKISMRRQRIAGEMEVTAHAEAKSRRHCIGDQTKVAASMLRCGSALLQHQKVIL
jgi:hypothetical protein